MRLVSRNVTIEAICSRCGRGEHVVTEFTTGENRKVVTRYAKCKKCNGITIVE